jgi:hypothetical protein
MLNMLPAKGKRNVWAIEDGVQQKNFLEPACGEGAFVTVILERKLDAVTQKAKAEHWTPDQFEFNAAMAAASVYGIELLEDNAEQCTMNLLRVFETKYRAYCQTTNHEENEEVIRTTQFIISRNIIQGNALTYKRADGTPIIFSEWTPIRGEKNEYMLRRKDFTYEGLIKAGSSRESAQTSFIPEFGGGEEPGLIKEYKPVAWLEIRYA